MNTAPTLIHESPSKLLRVFAYEGYYYAMISRKIGFELAVRWAKLHNAHIPPMGITHVFPPSTPHQTVKPYEFNPELLTLNTNK